MKTFRTLTPAYGRDYRSRRDVELDLESGRDFLVSNVHDPHDGKPVNAEQLVELGFTHAMVRFNGMRRIAEVALP